MHRLLRRIAIGVAAACTVMCAHAQPVVGWEEVLGQPASWYASSAARATADTVLLYQRPSGGWPKNIDMTNAAAEPTPPVREDATIDNGATTTQIRLLAQVAAAGTSGGRTGSYIAAALHGIDYLLKAQYPNGGWPQYFPLRRDYSRYITFNDNAMMNVMALLDDVSTARGGFTFVDEARRRAAGAAVDSGIGVILKSQIRVGGRLTAWCAQHDEITLEPRAARAFEHAALSGSESVAIVRFLMQRPPATAIIQSVDAAIAWFEQVRLPDGRWARFYELETNRPIFSGRNGVVRYKLEEIEKERQEGYAWYGTWPRTLVEKTYPAWKARVAGKQPKGFHHRGTEAQRFF
jgi:PelA/Pel-15E family pectate lyase